MITRWRARTWGDKGQALEDVLEGPAREELGVVLRPQALDEAAHHGTEELGLVLEAVIESALGDARALGHGLDAGGTVALGEQEGRGDVQDFVPDLLGARSRGTAAAAGCPHLEVGRRRVSPHIPLLPAGGRAML
jgi:hypothetical protein